MIAAQQLDFADAVDDQVAVAKIGKIPGPDGHPVLKIGGCIPKILYLAGDFPFILIHQHQLVRDALHRQRVSDVRAYVSKPQHCDDSFLCHFMTFLSCFLRSLGCPGLRKRMARTFLKNRVEKEKRPRLFWRSR